MQPFQFTAKHIECFGSFLAMLLLIGWVATHWQETDTQKVHTQHAFHLLENNTEWLRSRWELEGKKAACLLAAEKDVPRVYLDASGIIAAVSPPGIAVGKDNIPYPQFGFSENAAHNTALCVNLFSALTAQQTAFTLIAKPATECSGEAFCARYIADSQAPGACAYWLPAAPNRAPSRILYILKPARSLNWVPGQWVLLP